MKLTQIKRKLTISAPTFSSGASTWTITTSAAHNLLAATDAIKFTDPVSGIQYNVTTAAGTTGSTVVFSSTDPYVKFPEFLEVENYGTGFTGNSDVFTFSYVDTINGLVHVVSNGTAALASTGVKLQGSLDGIHWIDIGSAIASLTAGAMGEVAVTKPYVYGRLVFSGAITVAAGGANTIKAYKSGC
jgi:hypothetical protein